MPINKQYILRARPTGELSDTDLEMREVPVRTPEAGEIQLRTTYYSIDPTIRIWMSDIPQYMPPIELGEVVRSLGTAVVEKSNHPGFEPGDRVMGFTGWQTYPTGTPEALSIAGTLPAGVSDQHALGVLSMTSGITAYFGLLDVAAPKAGETVVVTAAAGAVGSLVGQIAKIQGCRVVGIAGSPDKCRYVTKELGFDACIDYKSEDVAAALRRHCPNGIDVDFENVAGPIFDEILLQMNLHGRISLCGLIAGYNQLGGEAVGPKNFAQILMKRVRVQGFIVLDYAPRVEEAQKALAEWVAAGRIKQRVYELAGFHKLPDALRELVGGASGNIGKMLVRASPT